MSGMDAQIREHCEKVKADEEEYQRITVDLKSQWQEDLNIRRKQRAEYLAQNRDLPFRYKLIDNELGLCDDDEDLCPTLGDSDEEEFALDCEEFALERLQAIFSAFFPRQDGKAPRDYQTKCALDFVMTVLRGDKQKSFLAHIGCAGGKTEIMMAAAFFLLAYTNTQNVIMVSNISDDVKQSYSRAEKLLQACCDSVPGFAKRIEKHNTAQDIEVPLLYMGDRGLKTENFSAKDLKDKLDICRRKRWKMCLFMMLQKFNAQSAKTLQNLAAYDVVTIVDEAHYGLATEGNSSASGSMNKREKIKDGTNADEQSRASGLNKRRRLSKDGKTLDVEMKNLDASGSEVNQEAAVQLVDSDSENGDDDKVTSTKNYQIFMTFFRAITSEKHSFFLTGTLTPETMRQLGKVEESDDGTGEIKSTARPHFSFTPDQCFSQGYVDNPMKMKPLEALSGTGINHSVDNDAQMLQGDELQVLNGDRYEYYKSFASEKLCADIKGNAESLAQKILDEHIRVNLTIPNWQPSDNLSKEGIAVSVNKNRFWDTARNKPARGRSLVVVSKIAEAVEMVTALRDVVEKRQLQTQLDDEFFVGTVHSKESELRGINQERRRQDVIDQAGIIVVVDTLVRGWNEPFLTCMFVLRKVSSAQYFHQMLLFLMRLLLVLSNHMSR